MNSYLKHYKMRLHTLAPVFIGSGETITKKEYIFKNNKIYILDLPKLFELINKRNLTDSYMKFVLNGNGQRNSRFTETLASWLDKNNIKNYDDVTAYVLNGVRNIEEKKSLKGIQLFIKNAYNEPYIPGSSIKGLLRTVLMWNSVKKNYGTTVIGKLRKEAEVRTKQSDSRSIKKKVGVVSDSLEKLMFTKKKDDDEWSIMRGLIVGDSIPVSRDDLVLCEKIDINTNGDEKTPNIFRECIKPGVDIEFDLTIDSRIFPCRIEDIIKQINIYSKDYYNIVTCSFEDREKEDGEIFIGGGAGYFSKTVSYALFNMNERYSSVNFVRDFMVKTTNPKHGHRNDRDISPHMQKCTVDDGELYNMGQCRIELVG